MMTHAPSILLLLVTTLSIKNVFSFTTPPSVLRNPTHAKHIMTIFSFESPDHDSERNVDETAPSPIDENRRKLLSVAPAIPFLLGSHAASASTAVASPMDAVGVTIAPQQVNAGISMQRTPLCADSAEESRIAIFERVAPSVVYIDTFSEKRDVFSTNIMEVPVGSGSGYIWDEQGHIITNFHVVQEAKSAQVAILTSGNSKSSINPSYTSVRPGALGSDGSTVLKDFTRTVYKAKVVGVDPTKDIAVLKVNDVPIRELRPIEVGTSTGLRVGQGALAIGNPFGLDHTLT